MDGAERWRILRLHVEDEIPLAELARDTKVSLRTLERWHRLFQEGGIAALDPRPRVDAGTRRTAAETVAFIERLALTKPRPSLATLHRLAVADARQRNAPAPGYSTVRDIVTALDPGLVTLALEGPASYRDRHELVHRRRAERPNQIPASMATSTENDTTTPRIMNGITKLVELLIIDEAERLTPTALELLRDNHDRTHLGIILIGMPGIDQRFRHYPQLYSRLGFSHRYRALGRHELLFVLDRHWKRLGRSLEPDDFTDAQAIAAIERITRGNFRLIERLFPRSPEY